MNIWEIDKVFLFLVLVLPGFISLKVYDSLIASDKRDFSKAIVEIVCFSVLNFAALSWLLVYISGVEFVKNHPIQYWVVIFLVFLVFPVLWPFFYLKLTKTKLFKKYMLDPRKQPWDAVFSNKDESYWVVIHLKNGKKIRGKYATNSFASAYPSERQIYLEELWEPNEKGGFKSKVVRTKGVIVSQDEISLIKFYGK